MEVTQDREASYSLLTALSRAGGYEHKVAALDLLDLLGSMPARADSDLLVGLASRDDAAVIRLRDDLALVLTLDFFPALIDDPYDFGRIAAADALSDVYAMAGTPVAALNVVAFPLADLGSDPLREIMRGGSDVVGQAGAIIVGGHTINDGEPKYGLAVAGVIDPARLLTNAGGRSGDALVLTKPLGTGAVVTAHKRGHRCEAQMHSAVETMAELNREAADAGQRAGAHAMTDITGFGLLGHLHNLAFASGLAAQVYADAVPVLDGVEPLLAGDLGLSSDTIGNLQWAAGFARCHETVLLWRLRLLVDATISGGLLIAVPPEAAAGLPGTRIGRLQDGPPGVIEVL